MKNKNNDNTVIAPFSKMEIANLDELQKHVATYFCPACNAALIPDKDGFKCITCGYERDWAFSIDASGERLARLQRK